MMPGMRERLRRWLALLWKTPPLATAGSPAPTSPLPSAPNLSLSLAAPAPHTETGNQEPAAPAAHPLARDEFARRFVAELQRAAPGLGVRITGELELRVAAGEGDGSQVFLANAYDAYLRQPAQLGAIFDNYARALAQLDAVCGEPVDPERIVPVIKDRAWRRETLARLGAHPAYRAGQEQVFEDYNDELVIFYAEDLPHGIRYLTAEGIQRWRLGRESLRPLAVRNLRALLPTVQVLGADGLFLVAAGGNYEASLLLFEPLWRERKMEVRGDYVVAVPARDTLLVTGDDDGEGLRRVRDAVARVYPQAPYRLSNRLFVRRAGKFELLDE